jgi:hypothetical protein
VPASELAHMKEVYAAQVAAHAELLEEWNLAHPEAIAEAASVKAAGVEAAKEDKAKLTPPSLKKITAALMQKHREKRAKQAAPSEDAEDKE